MHNEIVKASFRIGLVLLLLLVIGEILVRAFFTYPQQTLPDSVLGWVYKPGSSILYTKEGFSTNHINSLGMNDDEIDLDKNRVLVLGDSYTEALHVSSDANFTRRAEKTLIQTDLINAGRSGLSPLYYRTVLDKYDLILSPDSVVMVLTAGDIKDINNGEFEIFYNTQEQSISGIALKPKQQGEMQRLIAPLLSKSALFTFIKTRIVEANIGNFFKLKRKIEPTNKINDEKILELLTFMMYEIKARRPVSILYIPSLEYKTNRLSIETDESVNSFSLFSLAAQANNISILSALDEMKEEYLTSGQPPIGFSNKNILHGHLNIRGHEAVTKSLLNLLKLNQISNKDID